MTMKKILIFLPFLLIAFSFAGCEKEGEKVTIKETIAANDLNALSASSFVLLIDNAANDFQTFTWTAVDYGFPTVVTYTIQVDKKANNFSSPADVVSVTSALTTTVKIGDLNKVLLAMSLAPDAAVAMQFRIKAVINSGVAPVFSTVTEATITPYAVVFPPIYMCGAATGGWDWAKSVEMRSSAPNVYQTIGYFLNNEAFRFFKQHDWGPTSYNYPYFTTVSPLFENANDGDKNLKFLGTTGYFKITVNMTAKSVAMESVSEPKMFMTGAALGGWDWTTNFVQMTWKSNGMFEAITDFKNGETFRFFAQQDWGPTGYNYPYFDGGTVSALFENANDGDKNFKFVGTTGSYKITLNMLDKIITMTAQ
jgi:starch-binding outer membrane protein SusE/F